MIALGTTRSSHRLRSRLGFVVRERRCPHQAIAPGKLRAGLRIGAKPPFNAIPRASRIRCRARQRPAPHSTPARPATRSARSPKASHAPQSRHKRHLACSGSAPAQPTSPPSQRRRPPLSPVPPARHLPRHQRHCSQRHRRPHPGHELHQQHQIRPGPAWQPCPPTAFLQIPPTPLYPAASLPGWWHLPRLCPLMGVNIRRGQPCRYMNVC